MSKESLRIQAEELLGSELKEIKGGIKNLGFADDCTCCESGCMSSCSVACLKGKSHGVR